MLARRVAVVASGTVGDPVVLLHRSCPAGFVPLHRTGCRHVGLPDLLESSSLENLVRIRVWWGPVLLERKSPRKVFWGIE